jgi:hypothetical protein
MKNNINFFDGYKFRQAMKSTALNYDFYGEDYELSKESRLALASMDVGKMWRHLYYKLAKKLA